MNANPDVGRMRETFRLRHRATDENTGGFELPGGVTLSKRQAIIGVALLGGVVLLAGGGGPGQDSSSDTISIYQ